MVSILSRCKIVKEQKEHYIHPRYLEDKGRKLTDLLSFIHMHAAFCFLFFFELALVNSCC